jgi:hypothetical protein
MQQAVHQASIIPRPMFMFTTDYLVLALFCKGISVYCCFVHASMHAVRSQRLGASKLVAHINLIELLLLSSHSYGVSASFASILVAQLRRPLIH